MVNNIEAPPQNHLPGVHSAAPSTHTRTMAARALPWFFALLLIPGPAMGQNLIPDPSFETGTASWTLMDAASSIDNSVARTGSRSIKLLNDGSTKNHNALQASIGGVQPNIEYEYSVWVRGNNVTGHGAGGKPLVVVRWRDENDTKIAHEMYMWASYGTYGWEQMRFYLQAPPDAAKVDIGFRSWWDCLTGSTNWDDVVLAPRDLSHRGALAGTYQDADASSKSGGTIESVELNYSGAGYFKPTTSGAYLEWNKVSGGASGGPRILAFRYTWEGNMKPFEVLVNGASQGSVKPLGTGKIDSWASFEQKVTLQPGDNTVRIKVAQVTAGPLLDRLDVYHEAGAVLPTLEAPTITPDGGSFSGTVQVSLAASPGAAIYYTKNGAAPDRSSAKYTGPFTLSQTATVKALAAAAGYQDSPVASARFTRDPDPQQDGGALPDQSIQPRMEAGVEADGGVVPGDGSSGTDLTRGSDTCLDCVPAHGEPRPAELQEGGCQLGVGPAPLPLWLFLLGLPLALRVRRRATRS